MKKETKRIKDPWSDQNNLRREEIRGIFAIGALAVFYGIRSFVPKEGLIVVSPYVGPIPAELVHAAINVLLFCWGAYIFLMTISISSDILSDRFELTFFSNLKEFAYTFFKIGVLMSLGLFVIIFLFVVLGGFYIIIGSVVYLIFERRHQIIKRISRFTHR